MEITPFGFIVFLFAIVRIMRTIIFSLLLMSFYENTIFTRSSEKLRFCR